MGRASCRPVTVHEPVQQDTVVKDAVAVKTVTASDIKESDKDTLDFAAEDAANFLEQITKMRLPSFSKESNPCCQKQQKVTKVDIDIKEPYKTVLENRLGNLEVIAFQALGYFSTNEGYPSGSYYSRKTEEVTNRNRKFGEPTKINVPCTWAGGEAWRNKFKDLKSEEIADIIEQERKAMIEQAVQEEKEGAAVINVVNFFGQIVPGTVYDITTFGLEEVLNNDKEKTDSKARDIVTMPDGSQYTKEFFELWEAQLYGQTIYQDRIAKNPDFWDFSYLPWLVEYQLVYRKNLAIKLWIDEHELNYRFDIEREREFRKKIRKQRIAKDLCKKYGLTEVTDDFYSWKKLYVNTNTSPEEQFITGIKIGEMIERIAQNEYADEVRLGYRIK